MKITTYLDFEDLKVLSQTCKYFDEISWRILDQIAKINLKNVLSHADSETFTNTKKVFQNVKLTFCEDTELLLGQLSTLPSIRLRNLFLRDICNSDWRILENYQDEIRTVTIMATFRSKYAIKTLAHETRSQLPKAKIIFKPKFQYFDSFVSFDEVIAELLYPTEIKFEGSIRRFEFHEDLYNVEELSVHFNNGLSKYLPFFKNLKSLSLRATDLKLDALEAVIENNKKTLTRLSIQLKESWNYQFPCQFRELKLSGDMDKQFSIPNKLLKNQKNLRKLKLSWILITKDLLDVLFENKLLISVKFLDCFLEESLVSEKIEVLNRFTKITTIYLWSHDINLVNSIFQNSERLTQLKLKFYSKENYALPRTVFKNMKILEIDGTKFSKFVTENVAAPNLEVCIISTCDPDFLIKCERLRHVDVKMELTYHQLVEILKSNQSLETLNFSINLDEFEKTLFHILRSLGKIKHFTLNIWPSRYPENYKENYESHVLESALKIPGTNWVKLGSLYKFDTFSFEIKNWKVL